MTVGGGDGGVHDLSFGSWLAARRPANLITPRDDDGARCVADTGRQGYCPTHERDERRSARPHGSDAVEASTVQIRTFATRRFRGSRRANVRNGLYCAAMTDRDYPPWEPPLAGPEVEHLTGALNRLRTTFRWKADDLEAAGLQTRVGASSLTLGGLLKHLAAVEDYVFTVKLRGEPIGAPWDATGWDGSNDWEFTSAASDTPEQLYALWDGAVERSRARLAAALADGGLDQFVHASGPDGRHASLRRLVCDLIEEYGRHAGHADLLREAVDGLTGEDPPAGWHARATRSGPGG